MVDVFAVSDIIVKHIKAHYPKDVAIVGYYGSYLQGRATERSDLDFFFIPATPRGREVESQFIIEGISFDFWPIGWDRAERMATSEEWSTTIIADCELLYVRSEEDLSRFMKLQEKISALGDKSNAYSLTDKAEAALTECFIGLARFQLAGETMDLSFCRTQAQEIASCIFKSLALLNQTYYTRMWGHYRDQVRNLSLKPALFDEYLDTIMFSHSMDDITSACERLTKDTLSLVIERKKSLGGVRSYKDRMKGYYEEERGMLNKLLTACERGQYETAFFVAVGVQDGLARILYAAEKGRWPSNFDLGEYREYYFHFGFPELTSLLDPTNFEPLRMAVLQMIEMLEELLTAENVPLNNFKSVAEFEAFYRSKV